MTALAPALAVAAASMAQAMTPPPPCDIGKWVREHVVFDDESPFPGPYRAELWPFFDRIFAVLSPDHPAREVTLRGSAQFGKTVTVHQGTLGAWFDLHPANALVVHPTTDAAREWVRAKWLPMRRANPRLRAIFGAAVAVDSLTYQETLDRRWSLKVAGAGSPNDLSGTTRRLVLLDDVSKFESTDKGDPEQLAESRAEGFEEAKILRTATPLIDRACRITRSYLRGTQEEWHVPCPHCGHEQPLRWENMAATLDREHPERAHFTCPACGAAIEHHHKRDIVARGRWVAANPGGDHPSFHLWRALLPNRDWASIAERWFRAEGDPESEQTFFNDVLGLPYAVATDAPGWETLRDRTENTSAEERTARGRIPARRPILTAGVDCQGDRLEYTIRARGRDFRAHVVDHAVIPHHIGSAEARAALDALLKRTWRNVAGRDIPLDRLAIDGGTYTDDVWDWAKRWPENRVIISKGARSANGPIYALQKLDRRKDGRVKKRSRRAYMVNVSALKSTLYADLARPDPEARGYQSFATGLGDAYFRGLASERRVLRRNSFGVVEARWEKIEAANEPLDCAVMAEFAARHAGAGSMTDSDWDRLEAEHDAPPPDAAPDLFDAAATVAPAPGPASGPAPATVADRIKAARAAMQEKLAR